MEITNIRLQSQQLVLPAFSQPRELVSWMGAMQAQDYAMVKWAVGTRLKSGSLEIVEGALRRGEILRTHVMRPTWHLVAAEDIRWMLKLSYQRIKAANDSFVRGSGFEISESLYTRSNDLLQEILVGSTGWTKQKIREEYIRTGIEVENYILTHLLLRAEVEGIICSGADKVGKTTYALLEERVPSVKELTKEEALAILARRYFQSHSPASLEDFVWWSGLPVSEARQGIGLIRKELTEMSSLFVHESCTENEEACKKLLHFLPSYDEYLISYKDRTAMIAPEHCPKAYTRYGLFYPVIMYRGRIIGRWNKPSAKKKGALEMSFFEENCCVPQSVLKDAEERYLSFLQEK